MKIMYATPNANGSYGQGGTWPESTPPDGWYQVSEDCDFSLLTQNGGFVKLTVTDGIVTAIEPDTAAWEAWQAAHPATQTPTEQEQLRADVDYLAVMEGVDL